MRGDSADRRLGQLLDPLAKAPDVQLPWDLGQLLEPPRGRRRGLLAYMWIRDRWEDVARSVVQLVLGTYMVWDARRQRLCERHFEALERDAIRAAGS